jgi:hypothetical protein
MCDLVQWRIARLYVCAVVYTYTYTSARIVELRMSGGGKSRRCRPDQYVGELEG